MELWIFAVRYDFPELETHWLAIYGVKRKILSTLRDAQVGRGGLFH